MENSEFENARFAPSPSGRMHLGNVYTALLSWLYARKSGKRWLVRIEDLDKQRCKKEYAEQLLDDLCFLGLEWDGEIVWQSKRTDFYKKAFDRLFDAGLLYPCFCRRADILASSAPHENLVYAGTCRNFCAEKIAELSKIRRPSYRVKVFGESSFFDEHYGFQKIDLQKDAGDFIVRRADGNFSYQLAVCVDDADSHVVQIMRGRDLLTSTHQQLFLYRALNFTPPQYAHIPLLVSEDGRRLSKRERDLDFGFLREKFDAKQIVGKILHLCGFLEKPRPLELCEAISIFDLKKLPKNDISISRFFENSI